MGSALHVVPGWVYLHVGVSGARDLRHMSSMRLFFSDVWGEGTLPQAIPLVAFYEQHAIAFDAPSFFSGCLDTPQRVPAVAFRAKHGGFAPRDVQINFYGLV